VTQNLGSDNSLKDLFFCLKEVCEQEFDIPFDVEIYNNRIRARLNKDHSLSPVLPGQLVLVTSHPPHRCEFAISIPSINSHNAYNCLQWLATWLKFSLKPLKRLRMEFWDVSELGSLLDWSGSGDGEDSWKFADESTLYWGGAEIMLRLKNPSVNFARMSLQMWPGEVNPLRDRDSEYLLEKFLWLALGDKAWNGPNHHGFQ